MGRVVFMCGPAGSGKSTYAKRLEAAGMVRLSIDVELWHRGITTAPVDPDVLAEVEAPQHSRLLELVADGRDVVVDHSFWSRRLRDDHRALLAPTGVVPEVVYVATPREVVLERIRRRAASHPDDMLLDAELAAQYFDHFEPPTPDEGPLTVVRPEP